MATAQEIKAWLALVANATVAARQAARQLAGIDGIDSYAVHRAADALEMAFTDGLEAHGTAVIREYLAANRDASPAA